MNCPKHVEFYSKTKFEKLVHLVGIIIRIYHYAHSPERKKKTPEWGKDAFHSRGHMLAPLAVWNGRVRPLRIPLRLHFEYCII